MRLGKTCFPIAMVLALLLTACGQSKDSGLLSSADNSRLENQSSSSSPYRLGSSWDRIDLLSQPQYLQDLQIRRAALATAKIISAFNIGTGFYLGNIDGEYLVATNYHVFANVLTCGLTTFAPLVKFTLAGVSGICKRIIVDLPDIDLIIFSLEKTAAIENGMRDILPLRFAFDTEISKGTPLLTIGHGRALNENLYPRLEMSSDCRVLSPDSRYKILSNPDPDDHLKLEVWSFATGCDLSPGDSGSAVINAKSGHVLGLFWASPSPKPTVYQVSDYLRNIEVNESRDVWKNLSYAVPSVIIKDKLVDFIKDDTQLRYKRKIIQSLLNQ
ncbi:MAG: hypothetical protein COW00_10205 [Bdellovibrio sp. CG12_big_fil_rev_8_21_14_0_65_39_13]|nr:MAG: hypothetical protein COW78_01110 [Bdellovibrio sp. CG22_combo_CG10-13_8_21_14_all_39_27]PIQ59483.1 MAG: hypothetical protein COW00_10205 [Bdellovibrio sp. CG12_big_fil_rev_8_21_14_0_65_39_13]PIR33513.1 MAG: hypothetical protein COV37_16280 [Bdellovibrio sp. CG11_big_fil_rev_8_21_14_0_20_39_38]PJB53934.1 MAG: hypothetical protein CO099_04430 [Bdellovibrio sp. CG_4_9_14_3_um_filter_39_7]